MGKSWENLYFPHIFPIFSQNGQKNGNTFGKIQKISHDFSQFVTSQKVLVVEVINFVKVVEKLQDGQSHKKYYLRFYSQQWFFDLLLIFYLLIQYCTYQRWVIKDFCGIDFFAKKNFGCRDQIHFCDIVYYTVMNLPSDVISSLATLLVDFGIHVHKTDQIFSIPEVKKIHFVIIGHFH